jgi:uncharacterized protein YgiM (DUF1202 family)
MGLGNFFLQFSPQNIWMLIRLLSKKSYMFPSDDIYLESNPLSTTL